MSRTNAGLTLPAVSSSRPALLPAATLSAGSQATATSGVNAAAAAVDRIDTGGTRIPTRMGSNNAPAANVATSRVPPATLPPSIAPSNFNADFDRRMNELSRGGTAHTPTIRYLRNGNEAYEARLEAIRTARSSIYMSTYALEADSMSIRLLELVLQRAREGIAVVIKTDAFPSDYIQRENSDRDNQRMFELLHQIEDAGGSVLLYADREMHRGNFGAGDHLKVLVTDGNRTIAGGRNMSSDYFTTWRDLDGEFGGTVATQLAEASLSMAERSNAILFSNPIDEDRPRVLEQAANNLRRIRNDVNTTRNNAETTGTACWVVAWDPTHDQRIHRENESANTISQALIESFDRAQREIILSSNYVNADPAVQNALVRAAARGVQVHIVTSGEEISTRSMLPYLAAEARYAELRRHGARVWETTAVDHGKMYVVDGELAAFGSYNMERAADDHLGEQLIFSRDRAFVQRVRSELLSDINEICVEYTGPRQRNFWQQIWFFILRLVAFFTQELF